MSQSSETPFASCEDILKHPASSYYLQEYLKNIDEEHYMAFWNVCSRLAGMKNKFKLMDAAKKAYDQHIRNSDRKLELNEQVMQELQREHIEGEASLWSKVQEEVARVLKERFYEDFEDSSFYNSYLQALEPSEEKVKGSLQKQGEKGLTKSWKKRYFALSGDQLEYFKSEGKAAQGAIDMTQVTSVPLHLRDGEVSPTPDKKHWGCGFQVITESRTYYLCAETPYEKLEWIKNLKRELGRIHAGEQQQMVNRRGSVVRHNTRTDMGSGSSSRSSLLRLQSEEGGSSGRNKQRINMEESESAAEKEQDAKKQAEEQRAQAEAAEKEEKARKEEAEKRKREEEEAERKRLQEEKERAEAEAEAEAQRKRQEEEAKAKAEAEAEAERKRKKEEEERKERERLAALKAKEEEDKRLAELKAKEEAEQKRKEEEAAEKKRAEEEAARLEEARKQAEKEEAEKRRQEEEEAARQKAEEERKRAEEEAKQKKAAEEEARKQKEAEEKAQREREAREKKEQEEREAARLAKIQAEEEERIRKKLEREKAEQAAKQAQLEKDQAALEAARKKQEEEERERAQKAKEADEERKAVAAAEAKAAEAKAAAEKARAAEEEQRRKAAADAEAAKKAQEAAEKAKAEEEKAKAEAEQKAEVELQEKVEAEQQDEEALVDELQQQPEEEEVEGEEEEEEEREDNVVKVTNETELFDALAEPDTSGAVTTLVLSEMEFAVGDGMVVLASETEAVESDGARMASLAGRKAAAVEAEEFEEAAALKKQLAEVEASACTNTVYKVPVEGADEEVFVQLDNNGTWRRVLPGGSDRVQLVRSRQRASTTVAQRNALASLLDEMVKSVDEGNAEEMVSFVRDLFYYRFLLTKQVAEEPADEDEDTEGEMAGDARPLVLPRHTHASRIVKIVVGVLGHGVRNHNTKFWQSKTTLWDALQRAPFFAEAGPMLEKIERAPLHNYPSHQAGALRAGLLVTEALNQGVLSDWLRTMLLDVDYMNHTYVKEALLFNPDTGKYFLIAVRGVQQRMRFRIRLNAQIFLAPYQTAVSYLERQMEATDGRPVVRPGATAARQPSTPVRAQVTSTSSSSGRVNGSAQETLQAATTTPTQQQQQKAVVAQEEPQQEQQVVQEANTSIFTAQQAAAYGIGSPSTPLSGSGASGEGSGLNLGALGTISFSLGGSNSSSSSSSSNSSSASASSNGSSPNVFNVMKATSIFKSSGRGRNESDDGSSVGSTESGSEGGMASRDERLAELINKLLGPVTEATEAVVAHVKESGSGSDAEDKVLAKLVRDDLCGALVSLILKRFKYQRLFAKDYTAADMLEELSGGNASSDVVMLGYNKLVARLKANKHLQNDPHMRYRTWVVGALNAGMLAEWLGMLLENKEVANKYYEPNAPLRNKPLVTQLLEVLRQLNDVQFELDLSYELRKLQARAGRQ